METKSAITENQKEFLSNKKYSSKCEVGDNNNNSYNCLMIKFKKGTSSQNNKNLNKTEMLVNIDNKMITFNLKKEKDFFNSINKETNYKNFKKQIVLFHKQSIPTPKNKLIKVINSPKQRSILKNIDLSSMTIKEEDNYIQAENFNCINNNDKYMSTKFTFKKAGTSDNIEFQNKILPKFTPITPQINKCFTLSRTNSDKENLSNATLEEEKNIKKDFIDTNENLIICNSTNENNYISNPLNQSQNKEFSSNKSHNTKSFLKQNKDNYIDINLPFQPIQQPKNMFLPNGFIICELCDLLIPKNLMIRLNQCKHSFCSRCAQNYYEDKIETGTEFNFTCPYYFCQTTISESLLKKLISAKLFKRFCRFRHKKLEHNKTFQISSKPEVSFTNKDLSNYYLTLQEYNKKNVLDISLNDNSLYLYSQYKDIFCKDCNLPSLFGKNCKNILKCLNCFQSYCKFCLQKIDSPEHFNVLNENKCCKGYNKFYSEQIITKKRQKYLNHLLQSAFCFFMSYWFMHIFILFYIDKFLNFAFCLKQKRYKTKQIVSNESDNQIYEHNHKIDHNITVKNFQVYNEHKFKKVFLYFRLIVKDIFLIICSFVIFMCLLVIIPYFPMISTFYF